MALICDRCGERESVLQSEACDLCHPCAMRTIAENVCAECGQMRDEAMSLVNVPKSMVVSPVPVPDIPIEKQVERQFAELFVEHGAQIYSITPGKPVEEGQRIHYEGRLVQVLKVVPGTGGVKWHAKILD